MTERPQPQQCNRPPEGWTCSRSVGHDGPCAARPDGQDAVVLVFEGHEIEGLRAVSRWLRDGLHLLLNDGPTRRAVDKLCDAVGVDALSRERP